MKILEMLCHHMFRLISKDLVLSESEKGKFKEFLVEFGEENRMWISMRLVRVLLHLSLVNRTNVT